MEKETFKPYIPAEKTPLELTKVSIVVGILLAILFGGTNAYLGLRVGMAISASIPAAVISMAVIRILLKRDSILENNMVQTIGSAGESVAGGCIFTLPAMFMWAQEWGTEAPSIMEIAVIAFIGGVLGVLFMVPLRKALIVKEHGILPYPEGTACAEILLAGEGKGSSAKTIFAGLSIAAVYKFIADGLKLFPSEIGHSFERFKGSEIGIDVLPALLGVGYICGYRVSALLFSGSVLMWFCILPCIAFYGAHEIVFPSTKVIMEMSPGALWSSFGRYIGAGALATGGIISLVKSLPLIIKTFAKSMGSFSGEGNDAVRTDRDLPLKVIIGGVIALTALMVAVPIIPISPIGAALVVIFGLFFATVSSRIVAIVGSSNNPVSGMTIASLLFISFVFVLTGDVGQSGMMAVIAIGSVICIIAAIAGDTSQDLKTGYILGATPVKQQIGEIIGVVVSAMTVGGVLYLLNAAWGFGSKELAAPQAVLMKMIVEGVVTANLPWDLVLMGAAIAVVVEILGLPVLPFAIGLYLPIHLSSPLFIGGVIRRIWEAKRYHSDAVKEAAINSGTLMASGMIAGEGIVGIVLALLAVLNIDTDISSTLFLGQSGAIVMFAILVAIFIYTIESGKKNAKV